MRVNSVQKTEENLENTLSTTSISAVAFSPQILRPLSTLFALHPTSTT
jgi:hypothetical protein